MKSRSIFISDLAINYLPLTETDSFLMWDGSSTPEWKYAEDRTHQYYSNNCLDSEISIFKHDTPFGAYNYRYNSDKQITEFVQEIGSGDSLKNYTRDIFTYDQNKNISSDTSDLPDGSGWKHSQLYLYSNWIYPCLNNALELGWNGSSFNDTIEGTRNLIIQQGNRLSSVESQFKNSAPGWHNYFKEKFSYDQQNILTAREHLDWNEVSNQFDLNRRDTFYHFTSFDTSSACSVYDDSANNFTLQYYDAGDWINISFDTFYQALNRDISISKYWNGKSYVPNARVTDSFDNKGNEVFFEYDTYDTTLKKYVIYDREVTQYTRDPNGELKYYKDIYYSNFDILSDTPRSAAGDLYVFSDFVTCTPAVTIVPVIKRLPVFSLFPIPSENTVFLKGSFNGSTYLQITILNQLGETVGSFTRKIIGNVNEGIDISKYPHGIYLMHLSMTNKSENLKFIKL